MKKILTALAIAAAVLTASPAFANDERLMFEVGISFGGGSGSKTDGNDNSKWCKHRNRDRLVMGAIRYTNDNVEVHVARWFHDEEVANCDRDMYAVGLGYVLSTQESGEAGRNDAYASWTPGIAYAWGEDNPSFKGKDAEDTNWRNTGNFQVFNRVALGVNDDHFVGEVALHRYGTFNPDHGENFITIGLGLQDLDAAPNSDGDRGLTPPPIINEGDTIINEGDNITNITVVDNNQGPGEGVEVEAPVIVDTPDLNI